MTALNKSKKFDAVKMMREIRGTISNETQNMSFDELKTYIANKLTNNKLNPSEK